MLKKTLLTIFCVLSPTIGIALLFTGAGSILDIIKDFKDGEIWKGISSLLTIILIMLPMWYAWKGTKLIPFITIFPIRVIIFTVVLLCAPIGSLVAMFSPDAGNTIMTVGTIAIIFLSLWGIWIKS